jgi:hypothetical protein
VSDRNAHDRIAAAVADLRRDCGQPLDPGNHGPVLLNRFFEEKNLSHVTLPDLTRGAVAGYLRGEGIPVEDLGDPVQKLAGFVFVAGRVGWAFVAATDPLTRRRFTAAHELGHAVMHCDTMGRFRADTEESVLEAAATDAVAVMEREANRFAAQLLMPEEVCRVRAEELRRQHDCCPRTVLAYRLAAELLVSREAMRYRLNTLELGDDYT